MLIDTRNQEKETAAKGFNPNVQNNQIPATRSRFELALFVIFFGICTLGIVALIYWIRTSNTFNRLQVKANEASSNIDVQLKKRRDTLIKMVDATQSSFKYEKSLLMDVTQLRSSKTFDPKDANGSKNSRLLDSTFNRMLATFENYPQIQSIGAVRDMMSVADYTEREIAASRRIYNAVVNEFNQMLYQWPANIVAASKKLYNLSLFAASEEDRKDVSFKIGA